jgi:hypothetical protein
MMVSRFGAPNFVGKGPDKDFFDISIMFRLLGNGGI